MKYRLLAAFAAFATLLAGCSKREEPQNPGENPGCEIPAPNDTVAAPIYFHFSSGIVELPSEAGDSTIVVRTNYPLEVNSEAEWLTVLGVSSPEFDKYGADTLDVELQLGWSDNDIYETRTGLLRLNCRGKALGALKVIQAARQWTENPVVPGPDPEVEAVADLLDVEFLPDGTARNISGSGIELQTFAGARMSTYYNEDYGRYAVHFNTYPAGGPFGSGYFKGDYTNLAQVRNRLADGHSIELLLRLDCAQDGAREIKAMCSHQAGGTGMMVSNSSYGSCFTYLPNVSTNGAATWRWATSGVQPQAGRYYHLVGVWDQAAGKAHIYVDGQLKKTVDAAGNFNFATAGATWFCVGGDAAGTSTTENGWWGDIVIARVYDAALVSERVGELWEAVSSRPEDNFLLSDLDWSGNAAVSAGCKFNVFGSGFCSGDVIRLASDEGSTIDCETIYGSGKLSAVIPQSLGTGAYTILVLRDGRIYPVGRTVLTFTDEPVSTGSTKCIAHRGYHPDNAHPENSIAALKYAQQLGCYGSEFDVWSTTDGALFVNHDGKHNGVVIYNSTASQVKDLTLSNGEKIPTLRDYLLQGKEVPGVKMVLELKHDAATDGSVALVKELKMEDQVEWISFSYQACRKVRLELPDAVVEYLGGDVAPSKIAEDKLSGIDYSYSVLNSHPEWIDQAHDLGLIVNVWTVDSDFDLWKARGVDMITTNQAEALMKTLTREYVEK